jgi:hypothetical protein
MLKIVLQMISRQNEKRSRSGIVSVDQNVMPAPPRRPIAEMPG